MDEAGFRNQKAYLVLSDRVTPPTAKSAAAAASRIWGKCDSNQNTTRLRVTLSPVPYSFVTSGQGNANCIQRTTSYDSLEFLGLVICTVGTKIYLYNVAHNPKIMG
jgi:hypothetical protein